MTVIRRTRAQRRESIERAARVAGIRWVVYVRRDGAREIQGAHCDPNDAHASAANLRRDGHNAWTQQAGVA